MSGLTSWLIALVIVLFLVLTIALVVWVAWEVARRLRQGGGLRAG